MKPLLYLFSRQIVNGVKRALRSPQRSLGLIFVVSMWLIGPLRYLWAPTHAGRAGTTAFPMIPTIPVPELLGWVMVAFLPFVLLQVASLGSAQGTFNQADLDVLFPTPVSPKLILGLRIAKDSFLWLVLPLFLALITYAPLAMIYGDLKKQFTPEVIAAAGRLAVVGFLLISTMYTGFSYGLGLYLNRPDPQADRQLKALRWGISVVSLGTFAYFAYSFIKRGFDIKALPEAATHPVFQGLFWPATMATQITAFPLTHNVSAAVASFIGAILISVAGVWFALQNSRYIYELAAMRSAVLGERMELAKKGDIGAVQALQARKGKFRNQRSKIFYRWRARGFWAIVWRDFVIQLRVSSPLVMLLAYSVLPAMLLYFTYQTPRRTELFGTIAMHSVFAIAAYMSLLLGLSTKGEIVKRVDVLKPLPLPPPVLVLGEVASKVIQNVLMLIPGILLSLMVSIKSVALLPGNLLFAVPLFFSIEAAQIVALLLFPDIEDVSQRSLRTMVSLFLSAGVALIPVLLYVAFIGRFKWPPILAALIPAGISTVAAGILFVLAGRMFARFDPRS